MYYNTPSVEGKECYDKALKMWQVWTNAVTEATLYGTNEHIREKFDVEFVHACTIKFKDVSNLIIYGGGFGADEKQAHLSAMKSFLETLIEVGVIPKEFLKIAQDEKLEGCIELQSICIKRWKIFTELLKRPQFLSIPSKPFNEEVTDEEERLVKIFLNEFKLSNNSKKRKLSATPETESANKRFKSAAEELPSSPNAAQNVPVKKKTVNAANFGAYPDYNFRNIEMKIEKLKRDDSKLYDRVNADILKHYEYHKQKEENFESKQRAKEVLERECRKVFPSTKLFIFGSTMNGCGNYKSDVDICAVIRNEEMNTKLHGGYRFIEALRRLESKFRHLIEPPVTGKKINVIEASVPIIKMKQLIDFKGLEVDLNINNIGGIYNSHLIHHYSRQDKRFRVFCILIKHFAHNAEINKAQEGTLNSYSWILMVIHFMQCACQPPILPNLQQVCPDIFNGQVPIEDLRFFEDEYTFESENRADFTALLMGFFAYYSDFDFDKYAISIKEGRVIKRTKVPPPKPPIFIEDPFDSSNNTARAVKKPECFKKITKALDNADDACNYNLCPRLEKIGIFRFSNATVLLKQILTKLKQQTSLEEKL